MNRTFLLLIAVFALPVSAADLPTVAATGGINWGAVIGGVALLTAAVVGGFILLKRRDPAAAAVVQAKAGEDAVAAGHAIASAIASGIDKLLAAKTTPAATAEPAAELPPPAPTGKVGVPGRIVLDVSGDPKVDMAAWQAAYFG